MLQAIRGSCLPGKENGSQEGRIQTGFGVSETRRNNMKENVLDGLDG